MSRYAISLAAATAALAFTLATTSVIAAPATRGKISIQVDYGDLDLTSAAGAATLYRRIEKAARKACGGRDGLVPLHLREDATTCVQDAVDSAVERVDRETLTALHRQRSSSRKA
jgi:UrcA family protein